MVILPARQRSSWTRLLVTRAVPIPLVVALRCEVQPIARRTQTTSTQVASASKKKKPPSTPKKKKPDDSITPVYPQTPPSAFSIYTDHILFRPSLFGIGTRLTKALARSVDYRIRVGAERFTDPSYVRNAEATEAVVSSGSSSSSNKECSSHCRVFFRELALFFCVTAPSSTNFQVFLELL